MPQSERNDFPDKYLTSGLFVLMRFWRFGKLNKTITLLSAAAVMGLSGCFEVTSSEFAVPNGTNASAAISKSLNNTQSGQVYDVSLGGAAYLTGTDTSGAHAYAGVMPGSAVGAPVTSSTATYTADYELAYIRDISVSYTSIGSGTLSGFGGRTSGQVNLILDTNAGTLTGSDNILSINGTVSGSSVTGTSSYSGVDGALSGMVGANGTVGAVHGHGDTLVYAGGFVGARN